MQSNNPESISQTYRVQVLNRDAEFQARADKTLLVGMELASSRAIAVGCRGGGCGMCKIRVLEGEYDTKRMSRVHVSEQEQAEGFALACRVLPRSDMAIESDHFEMGEGGPAMNVARDSKNRG